MQGITGCTLASLVFSPSKRKTFGFLQKFSKVDATDLLTSDLIVLFAGLPNLLNPTNRRFALKRRHVCFSAYVTAYIVVVLVAFGAAVSGTVWAVFIFVRR